MTLALAVCLLVCTEPRDWTPMAITFDTTELCQSWQAFFKARDGVRIMKGCE